MPWLSMEFSLFGQKIAGQTGIQELMDDLGRALGGTEKKFMLGGGNPAHIPQVNLIWRQRLQELLAQEGGMEAALANYDTPQGSLSFIRSLADLLNRTYGWSLSSENIALTNGSQNAFFLLFNLLAGEFPGGRKKKILFPLAPEYIGYADQALGHDAFLSHPPLVEDLEGHFFKYRVDFETLEKVMDTLGPELGALCASRPTNPSGNVLTDDEVARLADLAAARDIPFLLDNAYGAPFPGILFTQVKPFWSSSVILVLSLSKLGLPGTRTGIVIASPKIISALSAANAVMNLAGGNIGPALVQPLVDTGKILDLSRDIIGPYYLQKRDSTLKALERIFGSRFPWKVHKPEGALFLWLWFPDMKMTSAQLYEKAKDRNTVIVPGHYFFFGLDAPGIQVSKCIRINYAQDESDVEEGLKVIGDILEEE